MGPPPWVIVVVMVVVLFRGMPLVRITVRVLLCFPHALVVLLLFFSHAVEVLFLFFLCLARPLFEAPMVRLALASAGLGILPCSLVLGLLVLCRVKVVLVSVLITEGCALEVAFFG